MKYAFLTEIAGVCWLAAAEPVEVIEWRLVPERSTLAFEVQGDRNDAAGRIQAF